MLLDGDHLVAEALQAGVPLDALITDGRRSSLVARALEQGVAVYEGTSAVLEAASPVRTPSGVVAIAAWSPAPIETALGSEDPLAVALLDVQDPGNVGSVIRAADAFGATGVVALDKTADPAGWKALRGGMGSTFRVPVSRATLADALALARRRGVRIAAAVIADGDPIERVDWRRPSLLMLGNEGAGLPRTASAGADVQVTIPIRAGVTSLNVAATAAVILFEARRQRQKASA